MGAKAWSLAELMVEKMMLKLVEDRLGWTDTSLHSSQLWDRDGMALSVYGRTGLVRRSLSFEVNAEELLGARDVGTVYRVVMDGVERETKMYKQLEQLEKEIEDGR